jgi:hypothetical protein
MNSLEYNFYLNKLDFISRKKVNTVFKCPKLQSLLIKFSLNSLMTYTQKFLELNIKLELLQFNMFLFLYTTFFNLPYIFYNANKNDFVFKYLFLGQNKIFYFLFDNSLKLYNSILTSMLNKQTHKSTKYYKIVPLSDILSFDKEQSKLLLRFERLYDLNLKVIYRILFFT